MELKNLKQIKSRRDFLIASTAIAGGIASVLMLKPFSVLANDSIAKTDTVSNPDVEKNKVTKTPPTDKWFGFGFDIEKCIGCGSCASACKTENDVPKEPFYFRTWVEQYAITNDEKVVIQSPNGGIDGQSQTVPDKDIFQSFFVPKACNHCSKSPCEQVCPVGATYISPEGVVLVDPTYCVGCGYCVQACPYGCRFLHPEKHTAEKCTMCYHRIMKGLSPACVEVCPTGARTHGDLHDKQGELVNFIKTHTCHVLKPQLNTKPKLFYNALNAEVK